MNLTEKIENLTTIRNKIYKQIRHTPNYKTEYQQLIHALDTINQIEQKYHHEYRKQNLYQTLSNEIDNYGGTKP